MRKGTAVLMLAAATAYGQNLTGRWAATGKVLDNGERERAVLELKQSGNELTGKIAELGFGLDLKGTATGSHFELFAVGWDDKTPVLTGDVTDGVMRWTQWGNAFVGKAATPADEMPKVEYLEPPVLQAVPYNGLAKTPPMGWNSWNLFAEKVDDKTVRTMADAMVTSGMRDAGYVYVNIDDTWEGVRDAAGNLQTNRKFPDMKALGDYLHSKGLKFGIYSSPGPRTCAGYPASYGHEAQDAKTVASWGVDYLKYDWCSAGMIYKDEQMRAVYQKMGLALEATWRPIVYSLSVGELSASEWGPSAGANLWRTTGDINDSWKSMIGNIEKQAPTAARAGTGHWNDPDMLEIGNGHMTEDEYRTQMSLWALSAAPLLAGNDIRTMTAATKAILLNKEVIAVDQDELGKQATPVKNEDLETWVKPLKDGSVAVGVVNLGAAAARATIKAGDLGLGKLAKARDLWAHRDVKFAGGEYSAEVPRHGVLMLRVSAK